MFQRSAACSTNSSPTVHLPSCKDPDVLDPAFSLFSGALIHKQNTLAPLYPGRQGERSAVSVYGERLGEFTQGFPKYVLPKNMHGDGQEEPLASSRSPA